MAPVLTLLAAVVALAVAAPANPGTILEIASSLPQFSTLVAVAGKTGLAPLLSGPGYKTVFAPTNDAFAALGNNTLAWITSTHNQQHLLSTLYYHITAGALTTNYFGQRSVPTLDTTAKGPFAVQLSSSGSNYAVNGASVVIANVQASNGIIQAINKVLVPENIDLPAKDIVGTAQATPILSTLVKAVVAAGLASALSQPNGPFTVFAPTDNAFAAVPAKVLDCLLKNPQALGEVLTSHVVSGLVYSEDVPDGIVVRTLSGKALTLNYVGDSISISYGQGFPASKVILANVDTSNGAVHVIDRVIFDNSGPCAQ